MGRTQPMETKTKKGKKMALEALEWNIKVEGREHKEYLKKNNRMGISEGRRKLARNKRTSIG
jgi:hypothetical protein